MTVQHPAYVRSCLAIAYPLVLDNKEQTVPSMIVQHPAIEQLPLNLLIIVLKNRL